MFKSFLSRIEAMASKSVKSPSTSSSSSSSSSLTSPPSQASISAASRLMREFVSRTQLEFSDTVETSAASAKSVKASPAKRYLWTDAFALCNFLSLFHLTSDTEYRQLAKNTLHHVHRVLAHVRPDAEAREAQRADAWLTSPHGSASEQHPTAAGMRIGKPLPERPANVSGDSYQEQRLEWERDGQYFHYLTKWMHALDQYARVQKSSTFNLWARELADVSHKAFVYNTSLGSKRMVWKMSLDLSRPQVTSMGQHDALDGYLTAIQLRATARQFNTLDDGPNLVEAMRDFKSIIEGQNFATSDTLGIGGLLADAYRLHQLQQSHELDHSDQELLQRILSGAVSGLRRYSTSSELEDDAEGRLAFRELGLAIGLSASTRMLDSGRYSKTSTIGQLLQQLHLFQPMRTQIERFWTDARNQRASSWKNHEDINAVMLATALVPFGYLNLMKSEVEPDERKEEKKETFSSAASTSSSKARSSSEQVLHDLRNASIPVELDAAMEASKFKSVEGSNSAWLQTIMSNVGDARVVLIGEATHGTEEFYRMRCLIAKQLIEKENYSFVAVEGDLPDIYRVNRYVQLHPKADKTAFEALQDLQRFPSWMWKNYAMVDFIEWMRRHNAKKINQFQREEQEAQVAEQQQGKVYEKRKMPPLVGFYGLDLYSLFSSATAVIDYLKDHNPAAARQAKKSFATLESFSDEASEYGIAVAYGMVPSQQQAVLAVLTDLLQKGSQYVKQQGLADGDELVMTKLNAKVVCDAEDYYRKILKGGHTTWNIRDSHMVDTLFTLLQVYSDRIQEARGNLPEDTAADRALRTTPKETVQQILAKPKNVNDAAKAIVFAHNSHLGDARATARSNIKEHNVGQLVRERLGLGASFSVGFSTYTGSVSAATRWGGKRQTMSVNPALANSFELLFHQAAVQIEPQLPNYMILLRSNTAANHVSPDAFRILNQPRIQRAIGVQYIKATEFHSHYFEAHVSKQFDAMIHLDTTRALEEILTPEEELAEERKAPDAGAKPITSLSEDDEEDGMEEGISS